MATPPVTASLSQRTEKKPCGSFSWPSKSAEGSIFQTPQPQRASYPTQMEILHCTGVTDQVHLSRLSIPSDKNDFSLIRPETVL